MNKSTLLAFGIVLMTGSLWQAAAAPRATSSRIQDYVGAGPDLRNWSCGVYGRYEERDVEVGPHRIPSTLKTTKGMAYVGYGILPWLTPYLAGGVNRSEFSDQNSNDSQGEFGGGISLRLLDTLMADPGLMEDRFRIEGNAEYTVTQSEYWDDSIKWGEFYASLTVCIVNELEGNPLFHPKSIGIYAGPAFTLLNGSDLEQSEGRNRFGFTAGLEVYLTERVSLYGGAEVFENAGFSSGLNLRF
jgi:opacity protein-like surface antigen